MLNISAAAELACLALALITVVTATLLVWRERRSSQRLRVRVLEAARRLSRGDYGHTIDAREQGELTEIAHAFDAASANLRRQSTRLAALLDLDRALLSGDGLEPVLPAAMPAIAAALQCRSVSIVLLDDSHPDRARAYDHCAGGAPPVARELDIDAEQLRHAGGAGDSLEVGAVGVNEAAFLAPLILAGARAFRFCALRDRGTLIGFLCAGFRVEAHANDADDISFAEIAERLSLSSAPRLRSTTVPVVQPPPRSPLESGLHRALQRDEFTLAFQPIVDAHSHHVGGVEALVRWPRDKHGVSRDAAEFIPVAEQSGLIVDLGDWVLRSACQQFAAWRREGLDLDYISVNVSARQLRYAGLLPTVLACLQRSAMTPSQLQIEIRESLLQHDAAALAVLAELAHRGVRLALDDFGAGGSSFSALHSLPVHAIKIDRACVAAMGGDVTMRAIVEAAIGMGAALRRRVIAEGVENSEQLKFLEDAGCDALQGYHFAAPMPAAACGDYLRARQQANATLAA